jgi:sugar-specific transcriptional regulator TrmB
MGNIDYIKKELEKFGLTDNQAAIYLLLIENKELRIQEIAKLAKIPRSSVYENLKKLFELGIAEEIVEDNYKKIRPYPIGIIKHGLDEKMLHLQQLANDLAELEKNIMINSPETSPAATTVKYYKDRSGARQLYWNTLKAEGTTYVYSDWGRGRYVGMKFYESFVAESRKRNIKEKVLINMSPQTRKSIETYVHPDSVIARTNLEDIRVLSKKDFLIKGDTLMYDNVYAQVYLKNVKITGFEIESAHFVESQRSLFETLWRLAKPASEFIKKHQAE